MKKTSLFIITLYRIFISPILEYLFGKGCRFQPTCSEHMQISIGKYGFVKGTELGFKQLFKCHSFGKNNYQNI